MGDGPRLRSVVVLRLVRLVDDGDVAMAVWWARVMVVGVVGVR